MKGVHTVLEKLETLFRTFNNYVVHFIDYIETKQTIKNIFEKYNLTDANISAINNIIIYFLDFCIMLIVFLLVIEILSTIVNFIKCIFNINYEQDNIVDISDNENNTQKSQYNRYDRNNEERCYMDTQELDAKYIREMVQKTENSNSMKKK